MKRRVHLRGRQRFTVAMLAVIFTICLSVTSVVKAGSTDTEKKQIYTYYTSVQINSGDSLWSIANEYCASCDMSIVDYIDELKSLNGLKGDNITSGQYITVRYCSTEYK